MAARHALFPQTLAPILLPFDVAPRLPCHVALPSLPPSPARLRRSTAAALPAGGGGYHLSELGDLLSRAEAIVYTVADVAVSAEEAAKQSGDWLSGITEYMETILKILKDGLSTLHVPYSYGFAIIFLTVLVKAATFPLTKKQIESALAVRSLQPQVKAIQQQYAGDQERIQLETARLYKLAGVNPLAGCFPTLVTIPVWIGLYRALSNVANEGLLTEGFFWIPSLAGPTTIAAKQSGSGISWLFPFQDGHPPLGWSDTLSYLVLPTLLVISQYISAQIMQPQVDDPSQKNAQAITKFLPLLIGYFALSVPSGLSLYWLTNNILSTGQQIWLQKLGGAKNPVKEYIDKLAKQDQVASTIENNDPVLKNMIAETQVDRINSKQPQSEQNVVNSSQAQSEQRRGERFRQLKEAESLRKSSTLGENDVADPADANCHVTSSHSSPINHQSLNPSNESEGDGKV